MGGAQISESSVKSIAYELQYYLYLQAGNIHEGLKVMKSCILHYIKYTAQEVYIIIIGDRFFFCFFQIVPLLSCFF